MSEGTQKDAKGCEAPNAVRGKENIYLIKILDKKQAFCYNESMERKRNAASLRFARKIGRGKKGIK